MSNEIVFYTNPQSRGAIARWMLEETEQPYRTQPLTYGGSMKSPDYLAINAMGKVPTIVHGGVVVTECAAICAYLADAFPDRGLAPPLADRGAYYRWLFFAAGPLEAAVTNAALAVDVPAERRGMVGYGSLDAVLSTLERALEGRTFIAGDRFSAADVYVGSHLQWGMRFGSIEKRPTFERYAASLSERPAARAARQKDEALAAAMAG